MTKSALSFAFETEKLLGKNPPSFAAEDCKAKKDAWAFILNRSDGPLLNANQREMATKSCQKILQKFKGKKKFFHIGMGGSSLGAAMLVSALQKNDLDFVFIDHIDPDLLYKQINNLNPKDCIFYLVSKSGRTRETIANLMVITDFLKDKGYSEEQFKDFLLFATDLQKSELYQLGQDFKAHFLEIPRTLSGRFSALSVVGLLPALFADVNAEELQRGAEQFQKSVLEEDGPSNPLIYSAASIFELWRQKGVNQTVLMPYSAHLEKLGAWFAQLWAESLAKKYNRSSELVHTGLTPIAARGPSDQHSLMQLFLDGPNDKCFFILQIENFTHNFTIAPYSLQKLIAASVQGTIQALNEASRPIIHLKVPSLSEYSLGAIIFYFEGLTALMGEYFNIDSFNQPSVEKIKRHIREFL